MLGRCEAIFNGIVSYGVRGVTRKYTRICLPGQTSPLAGTASCRASRACFRPFPISPMSRVVFVSRRKADARTRELTDSRGGGSGDGSAPLGLRPGITSNVTFSAFRVRFVSGTAQSLSPLNLSPSPSSLSLSLSQSPSSTHDVYNVDCLGTDRRRRREVLATVATATTADASRAVSGGRGEDGTDTAAPMALEIRPRDNGWSYKFNPT